MFLLLSLFLFLSLSQTLSLSTPSLPFPILLAISLFPYTMLFILFFIFFPSSLIEFPSSYISTPLVLIFIFLTVFLCLSFSLFYLPPPTLSLSVCGFASESRGRVFDSATRRVVTRRQDALLLLLRNHCINSSSLASRTEKKSLCRDFSL